MCRNFNLFLKSVRIEELFFCKDKEGNKYFIRPRDAILADLHRRIMSASAIAEDCSKKSTKAGYDAGGMAIGFIALESILSSLENYRHENKTLSLDNVTELVTEIQKELPVHVKVVRDGGDLLKTWNSLQSRLHLQDTNFITNWETHIRQASQGDMYSESNAHPHQEILGNDKVHIYHLTSAGHITSSERGWTDSTSLFSDTHNGDINDAGRYKHFLRHEGFLFLSNSDSCVEPALKRFIYEHLRSKELPGALYRLAFTDPDFLENQTAMVDNYGYIGTGHYHMGYEWANQSLDVVLKANRILFLKNGQLVGNFLQRGFLRDDERSLSSEKITNLLNVTDSMSREGATEVTIAATIVARIFEYSHPKNKFVFQSFSPIGIPTDGFIGGGTYTTVRGGTAEGGEEGGEIIFYIPQPYDTQNYNLVALLSASEENAIKEQVALLDATAFAQGQTQLAQPEILEITSLPGIRARASITEGVVPIFDVLPGEIIEATADGRVRLFDIYSGKLISLLSLNEEKQEEIHALQEKQKQRIRRERLAHLKIFKIDYRDLKNQPIPCPYNKYGEEIIVIQPLALQRNTEKLFTATSDGAFTIRIGSDGIGLDMGTDDEILRRLRVKQLTHIITGAAGTSYLINTIAANIVRKLGLHTLPITNLDGFTGSDTLPSYVSNTTLFLANSNSGGTSDTIKLTHELAGLPGILSRIEAEILRRDPDQREVQEMSVQLSEIKAMLKAGNEPEDLPLSLQNLLAQRNPWIYVITNIEASALGNIGRGLDNAIKSSAGVGITNLPEEECVGSTFAAMASLQWQIAFHTYIGEMRGDISSAYAKKIYTELACLPDVAEHIVSNTALATEIELMAEEFVGGNFDFVYTDYIDGAPEEQAHKAAEMIQEMFAGWHFFLFQHGKYAHMKRRTRHTLGSILGHNAPPPAWPFFNARALKSPNEIGPRVATSFIIAHESNHEVLRAIGDYAPDFIFPYPADSIVLYPFQTVIIGHLISYYWGLQKKKIGEMIQRWNETFMNALLQIPPQAQTLPEHLRSHVKMHAQQVLQEFVSISETTHHFDNIGGKRQTAILNALSLLTGENPPYPSASTYSTGGFLLSEIHQITLHRNHYPTTPLDGEIYLHVLKDLCVELCNVEQAKQLADHFLVNTTGQTIQHQITVERPRGRTRTVYEYDYLIEYEGLGTFYNVEPVHPPKIAKAKKGWL